MRAIKDTDLVGKSIKAIDNSSVNTLVLIFTDDSTLEIWAEEAVITSAGSIPGIFVND